MKTKRYLDAKRVRARYGKSDMTIWRWGEDECLGFPKPIYIRGRRYWDEDELDAFDAKRLETTNEAA